MCSFKYKTYMNTVSILPQLVMKVLQTQNVKRNNMKKMKMVAKEERTDTKGAALSNPKDYAISNPNDYALSNPKGAALSNLYVPGVNIMPTILEETSFEIQTTEINNLPL